MKLEPRFVEFKGKIFRYYERCFKFEKSDSNYLL